MATLLIYGGRSETSITMRTGHKSTYYLKSYENLCVQEGKMQYRLLLSDPQQELGSCLTHVPTSSASVHVPTSPTPTPETQPEPSVTPSTSLPKRPVLPQNDDDSRPSKVAVTVLQSHVEAHGSPPSSLLPSLRGNTIGTMNINVHYYKSIKIVIAVDLF